MIATPYEKVRPTLQTGDLVLFSGRNPASLLIRLFTRSRWSHIGIVLASSDADALLLWESTTLQVGSDPTTHRKARKGVHIVLLSEAVKKYRGRVAVRRLIHTRDIAMLTSLGKLRHDLNNTPYERNPWELAKAALDWLPFTRNRREHFKSVFCSELVALVYKRWALLPKEKPANEYTPGDFDSKRLIFLAQGARLESETFLH